MTATLLEELKQRISELALEPAGGGCFEITVDGKLVYSKLETGEFPEDKDIVDAVSALAA